YGPRSRAPGEGGVRRRSQRLPRSPESPGRSPTSYEQILTRRSWDARRHSNVAQDRRVASKVRGRYGCPVTLGEGTEEMRRSTFVCRLAGAIAVVGAFPVFASAASAATGV